MRHPWRMTVRRKEQRRALPSRRVDRVELESARRDAKRGLQMSNAYSAWRTAAAFVVLLPLCAFAAEAPATLSCQSDYNTNTHGHRVHTRYVSALFASDQDPARLAAAWKAQLAKTFALEEPFGAKCAPSTAPQLAAMEQQLAHSNGVVVHVDWKP
jgi:hypothetical protein